MHEVRTYLIQFAPFRRINRSTRINNYFPFLSLVKLAKAYKEFIRLI
jgi:hypothetical protein